ncbi:hypothetical protein C8Q70DRAFT_760904 [Cubamyces menziesii]|nr:hypothetical protein C8Q70DRAFT_760904 [Cubamyces menziesii]
MRSLHRLISALTLLWFCSFLVAATVLIDNADPRVQYGGDWQQGAATADDYMSTLAFSEWNSATATIVFTGTSVSVFGALKPVGTWNIHSAYSVDGALMSPYINTNPLSGEQHHVQFFSQGGLSDGTHTLTIENMGQQFWFDYVAVETGQATIPGVPIPPESTTSATTSSTTSQQVPSQTSLNTGPPTSTSTMQSGRLPSGPATTTLSSSHTSEATTNTSSLSLTSTSFNTSTAPSTTSAQSTTGGRSSPSVGQTSTPETSGGRC